MLLKKTMNGNIDIINIVLYNPANAFNNRNI